MAKPWFRMYRAIVDSKKLHDLKPELFKGWAFILACTDDDGRLPTLEEIAFKLRMSVERVTQLIDRLVDARLFDRNDAGVTAHDWDEHNYASDVSTERVKRFRQRSEKPPKKRSSNVERNAPDTDTDTDTDTEPPIAPKGANGVARVEVFPTASDLREAMSHWNAVAAELGLPQVEQLTKPREQHLRARLLELEGLGPWFGVVNSIRGSPLLTGQKTKWKASFDWLVKPANFQKLIEGNYAGQ